MHTLLEFQIDEIKLFLNEAHQQSPKHSKFYIKMQLHPLYKHFEKLMNIEPTWL